MDELDDFLITFLNSEPASAPVDYLELALDAMDENIKLKQAI